MNPSSSSSAGFSSFFLASAFLSPPFLSSFLSAALPSFLSSAFSTGCAEA